MRYLILLFWVVANVNCSSANDRSTLDKNKEYMNASDRLSYDSTVLQIMTKVVDLTNAGDLFGVPEFLALYENPELHQNDALAFLANNKYSYDEKSIAIYSMQKAELETYKKFLGGVVKLFEEKKIKESMLGLTLSAPINKRYIVIRNFNDEDIAKLLKEIRDNNETSVAFRERIDNILSGQAWMGVQGTF